MRMPRRVLLAVLVLLVLLLPSGVSARTQTVLGSLTITGAASTDLVGVAVVHNPGFEKAITQQIPPFTTPVFVDVDKDDMTGQVVISRFDTIVVLTNTTAGTLHLTLTILDASGMTTLATKMISLDPHATTAINLSALLP